MTGSTQQPTVKVDEERKRNAQRCLQIRTGEGSLGTAGDGPRRAQERGNKAKRPLYQAPDLRRKELEHVEMETHGHGCSVRVLPRLEKRAEGAARSGTKVRRRGSPLRTVQSGGANLWNAAPHVRGKADLVESEDTLTPRGCGGTQRTPRFRSRARVPKAGQQDPSSDKIAELKPGTS